ncbi:MAG TPA: hypothetical protein VK100_03830 [Pseudogracilibacillus sp.]|nr:hypothetical protein [Pseudogracilibacillus sp.]
MDRLILNAFLYEERRCRVMFKRLKEKLKKKWKEFLRRGREPTTEK